MKHPIGARQAEFDAKLSAIRAYLKENGYCGAALATQAMFAWATAGGDNHVVLGTEMGVATFLVTPKSALVLANNIESHRISGEEFFGIDASKVEFWDCPWHEDHMIQGEIQRRVGPGDWISDAQHAGSRPLPNDFVELTYSLSPREADDYRALGKDCSLAMEEALADVRPGMNEEQVAGLICMRLWDHAVRPQLALVASDERVVLYRHPPPKPKKIKQHLMAVLCGKRRGLIANVTRMVHFGRKLPDALRRKHNAVCEIDMALNLATQPGQHIDEIFAVGIAEYAKHGFADEWKLHHQGGPTGYQGRSYRGTPTEERLVLPSQAFAWNPSITGTKSEDTILATPDGIEFLTSPTRNWPALPVKAGGKTWKRADIYLR